MAEGRRIFFASTINVRGVALYLQIHVAQPIALGPAPIAFLVIDLFGRNIFEQNTAIEAVCGL